MMQVTIENTDKLTNDERIAVKSALGACGRMESLDDVEGNLRAWFRGWFVYRGGHHVTLHLKSGDEAIATCKELA